MRPHNGDTFCTTLDYTFTDRFGQMWDLLIELDAWYSSCNRDVGLDNGWHVNEWNIVSAKHHGDQHERIGEFSLRDHVGLADDIDTLIAQVV